MPRCGHAHLKVAKVLFFNLPQKKDDFFRKELIQHTVEMHKHSVFRSKSGQEGLVRDTTTVDEFVFQLLPTGLPYSQFLEAKYEFHKYFKKYFDGPIPSDHTFRDIAQKMTLRTFERLFDLMEGSFLFLSLDASLAKDFRTFITRRWTFIDRSGNFCEYASRFNLEGLLIP